MTASVGLAPVYVLATEMTVASAPPARSGSVSGILETAANLGGALGIAFLGTLGGAVYRDAMAASGALGLSPGQWEDARQTIGGALTAAARLGDPQAADVAEDEPPGRRSRWRSARWKAPARFSSPCSPSRRCSSFAAQGSTASRAGSGAAGADPGANRVWGPASWSRPPDGAAVVSGRRRRCR